MFWCNLLRESCEKSKKEDKTGVFLYNFFDEFMSSLKMVFTKRVLLSFIPSFPLLYIFNILLPLLCDCVARAPYKLLFETLTCRYL